MTKYIFVTGGVVSGLQRNHNSFTRTTSEGTRIKGDSAEA